MKDLNIGEIFQDIGKVLDTTPKAQETKANID
jgi:hypothetical protein